LRQIRRFDFRNVERKIHLVGPPSPHYSIKNPALIYHKWKKDQPTEFLKIA
jgi:hypothetical protein